MGKAEDLIEWIINNKKEYTFEDMSKKFEIAADEWADISKILISRGVIIEVKENVFMTSAKVDIFGQKFNNELPPLIDPYFKSKTNLQATEDATITDWSQLHTIDEYVIYPGEERIYEIKIKGKIIKMEGKEIVDPDIFILKFYDEFGVMLEKYKGLTNDWAKLITYWHKTYGRVAKDMSEHLSVGLEAKEAIIDYVNSCIISDDYVVKEGMVTHKNGCLYIPTRIIKKILKRAEIFITIRKLGYVMKDILLSGSMPLKIENKSERFWRLDPSKFDLKLDSSLHIEKEKDQEEVTEAEAESPGVAEDE